jgi:hypothetical protein
MAGKWANMGDLERGSGKGAERMPKRAEFGSKFSKICVAYLASFDRFASL